MKKLDLPIEVRCDFVRRYRSGESIYAIAYASGYSRSVVANVLDEMRVPRRLAGVMLARARAEARALFAEAAQSPTT